MRILYHKLKALNFAVALMLISPSFAVAADVAVTLPPLAGLISMLDKEADVICLLANGADPHHFQLTPRKIEATQQTGLLIRASRDDGGWPLPPHHKSTLDVWPDIDHGWLSPVAVREALPVIAKALTGLHPERHTEIAGELEHALKITEIIEHEWMVTLESAKKTGVLMQHPSWRRLMQLMDIPVLGVLESGHHGHEFGPRQLEQALRTLNEHSGAWLIADEGHSNRALDWLQDHASAKLNRADLNALGTCLLSWPELMRQNLAQFSGGSVKPGGRQSGHLPGHEHEDHAEDH